jgi:hypothetical protein
MTDQHPESKDLEALLKAIDDAPKEDLPPLPSIFEPEQQQQAAPDSGKGFASEGVEPQSDNPWKQRSEIVPDDPAIHFSSPVANDSGDSTDKLDRILAALVEIQSLLERTFEE